MDWLFVAVCADTLCWRPFYEFNDWFERDSFPAFMDSEFWCEFISLFEQRCIPINFPNLLCIVLHTLRSHYFNNKYDILIDIFSRTSSVKLSLPKIFEQFLKQDIHLFFSEENGLIPPSMLGYQLFNGYSFSLTPIWKMKEKTSTRYEFWYREKAEKLLMSRGYHYTFSETLLQLSPSNLRFSWMSITYGSPVCT